MCNLPVMAFARCNAQRQNKAQCTAAAAQKYKGVQKRLGKDLCRSHSRGQQRLIDCYFIFK